MDWSLLYSLPSFVVGLAAGFQGVYERYARDSFRAAATLPGAFYLLTRGLVSSAAFAALYGAGLIQTQLWLYALACGTGTEVVLRSKVYVKQTQAGGGNIEELLRGPFDLLRWYQNLFLELSAGSLAKSRKAFVERHLPAERTFSALCDTVTNNLGALPDPKVRGDIETSVGKLRTEYTAERQGGPDQANLEKRYRLKLGYLILNLAGKNVFRTLLAD